MKRYNIYATLLDGYQNYLSSSDIYQKYWGYAEAPEFTEEEFEQKQFQSLIDRINRVPFDSESASQGTAFNEVVDCIIEGRKSELMDIASHKDLGIIRVQYNDYSFEFPISLCVEFANYYKGGLTQQRCEADLIFDDYTVNLYGYIDELLPFSVHDIKTTKSYSAGDFRNHWQHIVYPYCLNKSGVEVNQFEYNIAVINRTKYAINFETFTETYIFDKEMDTKRLKDFVSEFVEFLEANRELINDKKIFNLE